MSRHLLCITANGTLQNETLCTAKPMLDILKNCDDEKSEESAESPQGEVKELGSGDGSTENKISENATFDLKKHVKIKITLFFTKTITQYNFCCFS